MTVHLVTGHVHLPSADFYRSPDDFDRFSKRLLDAPVAKSVFAEYPLDACWLRQYIDGNAQGAKAAQGPGCNPKKDTLDYFTILAQKTDWLSTVYKNDSPADKYVWMDYGIYHQDGFTEDLVADFLKDADNTRTTIDIPGIWGPGPVTDDEPCWRFLGSMFVCPADLVVAFDLAVKDEIKNHLDATQTVVWDVNNWARVELQDKLPIRWYGAGHNSSMLTNYGLVQ
jgi:hypothetical protein